MTPSKDRRKYMRDQATTLFELIKGFTTETNDNGMKSAIEMAGYVQELTNLDYLQDEVYKTAPEILRVSLGKNAYDMIGSIHTQNYGSLMLNLLAAMEEYAAQTAKPLPGLETKGLHVHMDQQQWQECSPKEKEQWIAVWKKDPESPNFIPRSFQERVLAWALKCFGKEVAYSKMERNYRFLEEALELVQSCGCEKEDALKLVDYVYGREKGETTQEVGGVMVTLASFCNANKINMEDCANTEINRVEKPEMVEKIRKKQVSKDIRVKL